MLPYRLSAGTRKVAGADYVPVVVSIRDSARFDGATVVRHVWAAGPVDHVWREERIPRVHIVGAYGTAAAAAAAPVSQYDDSCRQR